MSYNIVVKRQPPYPPYTCEFINIDAESVPAMLAALTIKSQKYWWYDGMDAEVARWMLNKQKASFLMPCGTEIVNAIDRVYTLLDASIRGELHDVTGTGSDVDPFVYDPPLPQTVDPVVYQTPGLQYFAAQSFAGIQNIADGTVSTNFVDNRNIRQQLADLLAAIQAQSDEDTNALLLEILTALGGAL